ncbi:MAG TPA: hypothetical protein VEA92_03275 [Candidatus Paceibacterota bacterium]|nr:hypothetical protein [Candidatus Paceibacterota bacterium]
MNTVKIVIGALIAAAVLGGIYAFSRTTPEAPIVESELRYENQTYGYSFTYPEGLTTNEYTPENISVGTREGESFTSVVDVSFQESFGEYESFEAFAIERAKTLCAADGPDQTLNCTDVVDQTAFTTVSGDTGLELYLTLAETTFSTGETDTYAFGPVYAFPYEKDGSETAVLLIYQPLPTYMETSRADAVSEVASTLSID